MPHIRARPKPADSAKLLLVPVVVIGYLLALGLTTKQLIEGNSSVQTERWFGGLVAIAFLIVFTVVLRQLQIRVERLVLGKDQRLSTSKLQAMLWTYTLIGILLAIVVANWVGAGEGYEKLIDKGLPEEYMILLGGPFAAAIASKAIVATKVENGTLTKTEGDAEASASDRIGEAFSDDNGEASLVDTQYLLFNFLALVYVIGGYIADPGSGVPSIPGLIVGLTSVSAATYVSNKAVERDVPVLTRLAPGRGTSGTEVRVLGRNFLNPHPDARDAFEEFFVLFDGAEGKQLGLLEIAEAIRLGRTTEDGAKKLGLKNGEQYLLVDSEDAEHAPAHRASGEDRAWVKVPGDLQGTVKVEILNAKGIASEQLDFEIT